MKDNNTKDRIIHAARESFAKKGFQGATIAEIANKAGLSEGAIYRHFKSKEELLMQCVTPVLEEIIENMEENFPQVETLREFVKQNLELRLQMFQKNYNTFRILINELPYSNEMVRQYMKFLSKQEQKISKLMKRVKDLGQVKRTRNSLLFGLGQNMSLWLYMNFQDWCQNEEMKADEDILNVEKEHIIEDLTDYILYGISGSPQNDGERG
ncbi:TetR/AcrR family transcriptional regulator [Natranaerobius thermophilus]|uniref:Transcriptional regulator, TetR family n=1 Tax=Natranaerobius thermophilus (strain ATCC BAA-1301 / DSM 18059 / JW/NM-WN-LF) TaxID=457570 RepID=B2A7E3_NATTJ|nr:TetR/AcrR family transcriptional regulator [Natranaerobius thermophilus]ACB85652.1 transcriptional regulator, TetR family [Natranaerobius thermophilus JW/NM-WN-LF]